MDKVNTPDAWSAGYDGAGVGIAVIDSGVAPVSDFSGRLVQVQLPFQTWAADDLHGHGTMVAGIAAGKSADGRFIGIAPGASVFALNVNRPEGPRSSDVIDALQWVHENAHRNNIRVVNLSLSETVPSSYQTSPLDLAVERVWAAGVAVVVSAGNGGALAGSVDYAPANDPLAITVGATDIKGTKDPRDDVVASFSASGRTIDGFSKPELVAPGRYLVMPVPGSSTIAATVPERIVAPGYAWMSGTSFAAPIVAGAAAEILARHPEWTPDQVKGALMHQTTPLAVAGTGVGEIDAAAAAALTDPTNANENLWAFVETDATSGGRVFNEATWTSHAKANSTWTSAAWTSAACTSATWTSATLTSATWTSSAWSAATWTSATWTSATWTSATWTSSSYVE